MVVFYIYEKSADLVVLHDWSISTILSHGAYAQMIKLTLVSVFLSCVASFFYLCASFLFSFYCAAIFVLSSGRVSWFWCSILFERIKFSSIRTELSRANSFSTALLSNLESEYKCSHSNLQSFSSLSWQFSRWLVLLHTLKTTITIWACDRVQLNHTD